MEPMLPRYTKRKLPGGGSWQVMDRGVHLVEGDLTEQEAFKAVIELNKLQIAIGEM